MINSLEDCQALDHRDPFRGWRARFDLPEGVIYLDGNSLGVLPRAVPERVGKVIQQQWGQDLIRSWNEHGWFHLPRKLGNRIAQLIGAEADSVIVADSISVNLFKVLSCALGLAGQRRTILTCKGNFPSDIYVAQGLSQFLNQGYQVKVVEPEEVADQLNDDVAVMMITEVDYRTARRYDMAALTKLAHQAGAVTVWDLAHSAGAVPVELAKAGADFAIGCTYKYLNGGPGSPAFVYVRPGLQDKVQPALVGWWGHARPFAFETDYAPAPGIIRQQCGTQSILALSALEAALEVWDGVDMVQLQQKSQALCQLLIDRVEPDGAALGLKLAGPRDMSKRGSHVSFHCQQGYAVMQALIAHGVVGDFRAPDIIRFGITPLYIGFEDIWRAAECLKQIMAEGSWNRPEFLAKKAVT